MFKKSFKFINVAIVALAMSSSIYAKTHFGCPAASEIQSTDFTVPSIWLAPPVAHSVPDQVGAGFGGKIPGELLGVETAEVNHHPGWICVYKSEGGFSVNEFENKIKDIVGNNKFLRKNLEAVNNFFDNAEPYLKNYPKDQSIGFIGYQEDTSGQDQRNNLKK